MKSLLYPVIWIIKKSKSLSALSMRLTKITGKSKYRVHPKHLIKLETPWYLKFVKKSDLVLDLGCNNGQHSLKIAKKARKVLGLDYDQNQLKIAESLAKDREITNARFKVFNLEKKLKLKSNSFDVVVCLDVLEHLNNRDQLVKEIKRVLKPKRLGLIAIPNIETSWKLLQKKAGIKNIMADPDHKFEYTEKEARLIFEKQGFKILKFMPVVYDTPLIGLFDLFGGISLRLYAKIALWKKEKVINNLKESTGFRIVIKKK